MNIASGLVAGTLQQRVPPHSSQISCHGTSMTATSDNIAAGTNKAGQHQKPPKVQADENISFWPDQKRHAVIQPLLLYAAYRKKYSWCSRGAQETQIEPVRPSATEGLNTEQALSVYAPRTCQPRQGSTEPRADSKHQILCIKDIDTHKLTSPECEDDMDVRTFNQQEGGLCCTGEP